VHFSDIQMDGFRALTVGQRVEFEWERPGFLQDGYTYRVPEGRARHGCLMRLVTRSL
jgi:CspA family cold shock protein